MYPEQAIDFFDAKVQKTIREDGGIIYKMQNATGAGVITQYRILPGIELFYNDFHMKDGENQNKLPQKNMIEINHCREGRFECRFQNGDFQYIGAGDLAIHSLSEQTAATVFPLSHYHGISITIDLDRAAQTIAQLETVMGSLDIDLKGTARRFCRRETCFVLRKRDVIQHIFTELYQVSPDRMAHYLKVKVLELLMYLNDMRAEDYVEEKRYFSRRQVESMRQIERYMKENLKTHYTLKELAEKFDISLTSLKVCFKGIYGSSVYSYMKKYRMQAAGVLLRDTDDSITEIALKMGYDNPSKFSEAFRAEMGELPSGYRNRQTK